ncbi:MAG: hypothetical protein LC772_11200, partial [Chloroflexi bacterium]|nr:hypothetical protein [Chloroflexota bacterium]
REMSERIARQARTKRNEDTPPRIWSLADQLMQEGRQEGRQEVVWLLLEAISERFGSVRPWSDMSLR